MAQTRSSRRFQIACLLILGPIPAILALSPDDKRIESLWADLEKGDLEASRALLNLSARPRDAVDFLKRKLKPLKLSSGQAKALLLKLGNGEESVWKPAFEELEYFDPRLAIDLQILMDRYKEAPGRQRMVEVLSGREAGQLAGKEVSLRPVGQDGFNFFAQPNFGSWWAEHKIERINSHVHRTDKKKWTRAVRAIVLLEYLGTPDAEEILKDMAKGHPDAQPTKVAKEALKTLARRTAD